MLLAIYKIRQSIKCLGKFKNKEKNVFLYSLVCLIRFRQFILWIYNVFIDQAFFRMPKAKFKIKYNTVIPCTGMQCIKTQVLGNRCTIKHAF